MTARTFRPRSDRDTARGDAAAARFRASGMPALAVALACVDVQFGPAYRINNFKRRVERIIRMTYGHPEIRARFFFFTSIIAHRGLSLDQACILLRTECRDFGFADEFYLTLRWLRFKRMHKAFAEMVAAHQPQLEAAE